MNNFVSFLLTKLGLGVGASRVTIYQLEKNLHKILGDDFKTMTTGTTIFIDYNNTKIQLVYTIENNVVKKLEIK